MDGGRAWFAGHLAGEVVEAGDDPAMLDAGGWWAVMITFEGEVRLWRFARRERRALPVPSGQGALWPGVSGPWRSSIGRDDYLAGVAEIRRRIREGEVYQVNLCRVISAALEAGAGAVHDPWALAQVLAAGNPAPFAGVIDVPAVGSLPRTRVVCASPELFLRREGDRVTCSPIKGTGRTAADLLPKDSAENVMIVDLMRNDLQHACRPGSVAVTGLLEIEQHPGLVHLVSTVTGRLAEGVGWRDLLRVTMPPGSVSGAPKSSALQAISDLEPVPRGPYCGAIGWVDADAGRAELAVGIRSFWWQGDADHEHLCFGTGAGITWGSDARAEWDETELKADRLISLASNRQRQTQEEKR